MTPSAGRDDATIRGGVVLVVAIVIGLALLARSGGDGPDASAATTEVATSSTEVEGSTSSTDTVPGPINSSSTTAPSSVPADTRPPDTVTVIVLNGTAANVEGIAGDNDAKVAAAGYQTLDATGADIDLTTTTVYADAEFQTDAEAIKGVLGIPNAVVEEKPAESPGPNSELADVVVVIGDDAAG
ncbi:MAG: LytR C-terminal domain-containing protein [Iamia sp.]